MILLRQGQSNPIALTLSELSQSELPSNWLFVFTLEQSKEYTYKLYLTDVSQSVNSYNLFTLIEGTDVTFRSIGDYEYKVYQMPNGGSTDETLGRLVEIGKMRLIEPTEEQIPTFNVDTNTDIYDSNAIS
jgi:hypothetical protein